MAWVKAFANFIWKNFPSVETPLNATNLNKLNNAIDTIDDRVISLENDKANNEFKWSKYNISLSTEQTTEVIFQNSAITEDKPVDLYTSLDGLSYESMTIENGKCTIIFPQQEYDFIINVRIYVRN